jgi:hypothetical protein
MRSIFGIIALAGTFLAAGSWSAAAEDRFAPGNPWFSEFEQTCRQGPEMAPECQGSVLGAYAEASGSSEVTCDFAEFWRVRDALYNDETFAVLPWQYGVEALVAEPGVCGP